MIGLIRFWREGAIGVLLIAIGLAWLAKAGAERQSARLARALAEAKRTIEIDRAQIRAKTALAQAEDAAHAAGVEREQAAISQETSSDYQKQIADLRRRHDALRLRGRTAHADSSGGGSPPMPGIPDAAGGADGATRQDGLPSAAAPGLGTGDALIASEQALRLKALQDWVAAQAAVER